MSAIFDVYIISSFHAKEALFACFVDFKKAYDTVWRDFLFYKLLKNGVSNKFVKLVQSLYSNLSSCILVKGGLSTKFPSLVGVKQGCNLSPLLFNMFINDLVELFPISDNTPVLSSIGINCLLCADDIVLLSKTKEGLQEMIDKLYGFTQKWFLQVNTLKTKTLIFSRKRKRSINGFNFGVTQLPSCESYCYLGTTFSKNGSFNQATNVLYDKGLKSMFDILRSIFKYNSCNVGIMSKLFDSLTVPIVLYNSEVWGPLCFNSNIRNTMMFQDNSQVLSTNIQNIFLRIILGVGKKTSKWAILSETGRIPLCVKVMINMVKYWFHLSTSPNPILKAALQTNMGLSVRGVKSWFNMLNRIMGFLNIDHILYTSDTREIELKLRKLKYNVKSKYLDYWKQELNTIKASQGKVSFYSQYQNGLKLADYLSFGQLPPNFRIALTRFRMGAHRLPIETGRYSNLEREDQICPLCCKGIGDEKHYIIDCSNPVITDLRRSCFYKINNSNISFNDLSNDDKIAFVMETKQFFLFHI